MQGGMHTSLPHSITSTKCRTNIVVSPDDGHIAVVNKDFGP